MSEKLEMVEAYALGFIGAIEGIYKYVIKEPVTRKLGETAWKNYETVNKK